MKTRVFTGLLITLGLSACAFQGTQVQVTPGNKMQSTLSSAPTQLYLPVLSSGVTPTSGPSVTLSPTVSIAPLEADRIQNMEFTLPVTQKTVRLSGGKYQSGSGPDYLEVGIASLIAEGDLNGDGVADAALVLAENTGGTGRFESLIVVLNQNGNPIQAASTQLGDRVKIDALTIQDERIMIDMVSHAPNDPLCCPSVPVAQTFRLSPAGLLVDQVTTKTPDGKERTIHIDSPADGTQAGDAVQVKGSETISPFENTLAYRLYDEKNTLLAEGSFQLIAHEAGAPAVFATALDLTKVPGGSAFRLQILDISAADGSTLAMDSVRLIHK
ncbi:MAG: Gmad2 immunoglobulin-like domain-containing protein [Anaerolineaceae bacterium]|nr:Gmad2 immunoglobulin-like domain-containing protein [Anaerolineaceae bacterium]